MYFDILVYKEYPQIYILLVTHDNSMEDKLQFVMTQVIDGLPAEFVLGKNGQPPRNDLMKAMPYTQSLLSNGMAVGFHAKAAPPTVTMPRLKVNLCFVIFMSNSTSRYACFFAFYKTASSFEKSTTFSGHYIL